MKNLLLSLIIAMPLSGLTQTSDFERGYNAGLQACQNNKLYVCQANVRQVNLVRRSANRAQAIESLYRFCESPSGGNYDVRDDCFAIIRNNNILCQEI